MTTFLAREYNHRLNGARAAGATAEYRRAMQAQFLHQIIEDKLDRFLGPEDRNAAAFLIADMLIENGLIVDEVQDG